MILIMRTIFHIIFYYVIHKKGQSGRFQGTLLGPLIKSRYMQMQLFKTKYLDQL